MNQLIKVSYKIVFFLLFSIFYSHVLSQDNATDFYERGYRYLSIDKSKAIKYLTKSIELDDKNPDAFFHRGITYFKKDQFDSALADFDRVKVLNPDMTIIEMYKGFTYRNQGSFEKALESFSNYISQHPTDTSAYSYILRGKMKYELGDFDGAVNDYDMVTKLRPFEEKYNYYKFIAYRDAGMQQAALKCVSKLIQVNPDFYGYYFYKGQLFQNMNFYDSAVYMYNVAIIKNYQNSDSYYYRAQAYQELDKYEKAIEDYNTAIALNKNDGSYYSGRGNCKHLMGDKNGACEDWNEAGELGYYEDFEKIKGVCDE